MLQLSNSNCSAIVASSSTITDVIANPENYTSIVVEIKKNCCGTIYSSTKDSPEIATFAAIVPTASIVLSDLVIQNISGDSFTIILPTDIVTDCASLVTIEAAINAYMTSNYGTEEIFTFGCSIVSSNIVFTLTSGTGNFFPVSINYSSGSIPLSTASFTGDSFYFSETDLIILPNIIGSIGVFGDGIYNVSITFTQENGTTVSQSGCIFLDCVTKCLVAQAVSLSDGQIVVDLIMYHYGLTFAENCMCDCAYLCKIYTDLVKLLNSILPTNTSLNECGCA